MAKFYTYTCYECGDIVTLLRREGERNAPVPCDGDHGYPILMELGEEQPSIVEIIRNYMWGVK
tara:strand:+ start:779 stop:967 length:189 start_codon:yes stop_codon:yes gene_type:complete